MTLRREERARRVLVTGGAGFIGSHVVKKLAQLGRRLVVLDNLSSGSEENLAAQGWPNLEFVRGDILDSGRVKEALRDVDSVVHLAALVSVQESVRNPSLTHEVNVDGTRTLLRESIRAGVKKFVLASTCAVYGDPERFPITEGSRRKPLSPYAESKVEAERACRSQGRRMSGGLTILRFFNVYGPGQERSAYANVITKFAERLAAGKALVVYGDGRQTRDFVHARDVASAVSLALGAERAAETLNVGSGRETSINELAAIMSRIAGRDASSLVHAEARAGEVSRSWADISRARDVLGFSPRVGLEEGLSELLKR
jgi:UDP-glucose 4-epimerase